MTIPGARERVHVKGRKGLFVVVSLGDGAVHVIPLHGAPQVLRVALDDIEPAPELQARPNPGEVGELS